MTIHTADAQSLGTLYLVATPIGNLEDMTFRAVSTLKAVDWIAAEDTRHTGKLLQHFAITTPQLSYHTHNRHARLPALLARLHQGQAIALVSDAGTPGISDPGQELVTACIEAGITVVPIPGATALISALIASGLDSTHFTFVGFLPTKPKLRQTQLGAWQAVSHTLIFYEAPHRLLATLQDLLTHFGGDRRLCITRELTKLHEQFWHGTLSEAIVYYEQHKPKGEFCLVVAGQSCQTQRPLTEAELREALASLLQQGLSRSQASRQLAAATERSRREIYQLSLQMDCP